MALRSAGEFPLRDRTASVQKALSHDRPQRPPELEPHGVTPPPPSLESFSKKQLIVLLRRFIDGA